MTAPLTLRSVRLPAKSRSWSVQRCLAAQGDRAPERGDQCCVVVPEVGDRAARADGQGRLSVLLPPLFMTPLPVVVEDAAGDRAGRGAGQIHRGIGSRAVVPGTARILPAAGVVTDAAEIERDAAVGGLERAGVGHGVGRGDLQGGALVGVDRALVGQREGEATVVDADLAGALDRVIRIVGQGQVAGGFVDRGLW